MIRIISLFSVVVLMISTSVLGAEPSGRRLVSQASPVRTTSGGEAVASPTRVARKSQPRPSSPVRPASHADIIYEDEGIVEGEPIIEQSLGLGAGCETCGGACGTGDCALGSCGLNPYGLNLCNTCNSPRRLCICLPAHAWVNVEYLNWYQSGMNIPALVTTNPNSGILPSAAVVLGNEEILKDNRNGGRIRFGWWFVNNSNLGIEGEYFGLSQEEEVFLNEGRGTPFLARPFFNVTTGQNDSQIFSSTGLATGSLTTTALSDLDGAAVRLRRAMCCSSGCDFSWWACSDVPVQSRIDATVGWRYLQLSEQLTMTEQLNQQTGQRSVFQLVDDFKTTNIFNGGELGYTWQARRGFWSVDTIVRASIGNVNQTVTIGGSTRIDNVLQSGGGFLAQSSNIGTFERNQLAVLPEVGATLGYQLTPRLRCTVGYTFLMLSSVVRPGDQISLDLNENLLAPAQSVGAQVSRPEFQFVQSDYWVHGISFGGELRW